MYTRISRCISTKQGLASLPLPPAGLLPEFDGVDKAEPNCVVIGDAAEKFSYQNLNEAFRVLTGLEKPVLFSLGQGYEPVETNQQNSVTQCEIYIMHFYLFF